MRPIDADVLYDKAETWYKNAPTPYRQIYRSIVDTIADAPTITPPPNDPLTPEELREMGGEPVWVIPIDSPHQRPGWMQVMSEFNIVARHESIAKSVYARFGGYGNEWIAYRRKPEMSVLTAPFPSPVWAEHFHARFERTE